MENIQGVLLKLLIRHLIQRNHRPISRIHFTGFNTRIVGFPNRRSACRIKRSSAKRPALKPGAAHPNLLCPQRLHAMSTNTPRE
jgi:hypothetical protein